MNFTFGPADPTVESREEQFTSVVTDSNKIVSYNWSFGDGKTSTSANPKHEYATLGTFNVTLTVTDSKKLTGSKTESVTVTEPFSVILAATQSKQNPLVFDFTRTLTKGTDDEVVSRNLDFGDGTSIDHSEWTHTYAKPGVYKVVLTMKDQLGQTATDTKTVTAVTAPVITSVTDSGVGMTKAFNVAFTDTNPNNPTTTFLWNFGDGTTSTDQNPSHTYTTAGNYTVEVTVTDATYKLSSDKTLHNVQAIGPLGVSIKDTVNKLKVAFTSQVTKSSNDSIASYSWSFGDGGTSTSANPSHTYAKAASYNVTLTVTDKVGQTANASASVTVQ